MHQTNENTIVFSTLKYRVYAQRHLKVIWRSIKCRHVGKNDQLFLKAKTKQFGCFPIYICRSWPLPFKSKVLDRFLCFIYWLAQSVLRDCSANVARPPADIMYHVLWNGRRWKEVAITFGCSSQNNRLTTQRTENSFCNFTDLQNLKSGKLWLRQYPKVVDKIGKEHLGNWMSLKFRIYP